MQHITNFHMRRNQQQTQSDKQFKCDTCDFRATNSGDLIEHFFNQHIFEKYDCINRIRCDVIFQQTQ